MGAHTAIGRRSKSVAGVRAKSARQATKAKARLPLQKDRLDCTHTTHTPYLSEYLPAIPVVSLSTFLSLRAQGGLGVVTSVAFQERGMPSIR